MGLFIFHIQKHKILEMGNINLEQQMRQIFVISSLLMLAPRRPDESSLWAALIFILIFS